MKVELSRPHKDRLLLKLEGINDPDMANTLRGKVLAIGGLKEKTLAAYRAGVKTVLIPEDNVRDLDDIDKEAKENLTFIPCSTAMDVLKNALAI